MSTDTDLDYAGYDQEVDDELIDDQGDVYAPYRSVSRAAISSVFLLVLSATGLLFPVLLSLAAVGAVIGWIGWRNIRRYPEELTGRVTALLGTVGCVLMLAGGSAMHTYIYLTEVPEGYERISFRDLQFDTDHRQTEPQLPYELDGKRIFVKGYVHPGVSSMGLIHQFILVPDMGTCCFGGQPALTDMIEVTIVDAPGVRYSQRKRKLGGILTVHNRLKPVAGGLQGGYYELKADHVR
jgi:hypothetical protein